MPYERHDCLMDAARKEPTQVEQIKIKHSWGHGVISQTDESINAVVFQNTYENGLRVRERSFDWTFETLEKAFHFIALRYGGHTTFTFEDGSTERWEMVAGSAPNTYDIVCVEKTPAAQEVAA